MKTFFPKSQKMKQGLQLVLVLAFLFMLYWNLSIYKETCGLARANHHLEETGFRLSQVAKKIDKFNETKRALVRCGDNKHDYDWQDVSLQFDPIDFNELLNRLALLNHEIERKYHKRGIFVLTEFETVRKNNDDTASSKNNILNPQATRPAFKVLGRLLCLCQ